MSLIRRPRSLRTRAANFAAAAASRAASRSAADSFSFFSFFSFPPPPTPLLPAPCACNSSLSFPLDSPVPPPLRASFGGRGFDHLRRESPSMLHTFSASAFVMPPSRFDSEKLHRAGVRVVGRGGAFDG
jgi:hypothetical protein